MYSHYLVSELQHKIAAADDTMAYKELFFRFQPGLLHFAKAICHHHEAAEEIVSDVFIRVWTRRKTLDQIENL